MLLAKIWPYLLGLALLVLDGLKTKLVSRFVDWLWSKTPWGKERPSQTTPAVPAEILRARKRVSRRIELTVGQLETVDHQLKTLRMVAHMEKVLRDVAKLASEFSHDDLQDMDDADVGKNVIAYYRDVQTGVDRIRDLAGLYERIRGMSDVEEKLAMEKQWCQAIVSQGIRQGKTLVEQIRALK